MAKRTYKSENRIQQECYMRFNNKYPHLRKLLFAVPNGGARSAREGKLFKDTGTVAGVSDMILLYKTRAFCFELKTEIGTQSALQLDWQKKVEAQDIPYIIIRSSDQFMFVIEHILNMTK